ncbi:O-methyl transferase family protein [Pseudomonas aeruginosa]|nr:O-methyl transferase family protein [Pseudomonas aeruginosa]
MPAALVDHCLHADLMDTMVSKQSFGLLWLNPPYGDLSKGRQRQHRLIRARVVARLEKLFYQRSLSLLQYGGVLVFIVPGYVLDAELVGWLTRHYTDLRIYRAGGDAVQASCDLRPAGAPARAGLGWRQGRAQSAAAGWARRDRS